MKEKETKIDRKKLDEKSNDNEVVDDELKNQIITEMKEEFKVLDDTKKRKQNEGAKSLVGLVSEILKKP